MNLNTRIARAAGAAVLSLLILTGIMAATPHSTYAASPVTAGNKAQVTNTDGDNIRVRSGAGTSFNQVAEAHGGETVAVLDGPTKDSDGNTWYKVQAPGGTGWVMSDYLAGKDTPSTKTQTQTQTQQQAPQKQAAPTGPKLSGNAHVGNSDGDPVRLRAQAGSDATVLDKLDPNTSVTIKQGPTVDSAGTAWYKVSANGTTGWMMAQYLVQDNTPAQAPAAPAAPVVVSAPVAPAPAKAAAAPVQSAPQAPAAQAPIAQAPAPAASSLASAIAAAAPAAPAAPATVVAPVAQAPVVEQARTGGAQSAESLAALRGSATVNAAMRYLGYRYVYGGTSPRGFDCSGFVYYVMNRVMGMSMSRDMYSELNSGPRVSSDNLRPGDIVFFVGTYKRGLSHAGIYIGNGRFIHAENESTGVTISDLWSSYWRAHYYTAVRPSK